jgi:hypothetical protein
MATWRHVVGEERTCGLMIPVCENNVPFFVIGVHEGVCFWRVSDDDGADQAIDILILKMGMPPVSIISGSRNNERMQDG